MRLWTADNGCAHDDVRYPCDVILLLDASEPAAAPALVTE